MQGVSIYELEQLPWWRRQSHNLKASDPAGSQQLLSTWDHCSICPHSKALVGWSAHQCILFISEGMLLETFWRPNIGRTSATPGWQIIARPACASVSLAGHDLSVEALE